MAQDYEINVKVTGVDQAKTKVEGLTDSMDSAGEAGSAAFGQLNGLLGGMPGKFKGAVTGIRGMVRGMKTLRGAIISTGVGALVVALGSLVAYFQNTERGSQELRVAMATLGGVMDALMDKVIHLGEFLVQLFTNPQGAIEDFGNMLKTYVLDQVESIITGLGLLGNAISLLFEGEFSAAADTAQQGLGQIAEGALGLLPATAPAMIFRAAVMDMAPAIYEAAQASQVLAQRSNELRVSQRQLAVDFAEGRKEIKRFNLIAEDTTKGYDERIDAAQRAIDIEKGLMAQRLKNATEELRIHEEQMKLSENTEEDLDRRKDLQVALLNMQTESFELQTTLNNKLNTLEQARTAEKQAEIDKQAAAQKAADEAATKDSLAEQKKREQLEKNHQQAIQELRMAAVGGTFSMLKNLNTAFEKDTEEGQKKAFNRNKAISIAETLVSTYSAAQKAYASQLSVPTPDAPIRAQIAAGIAVAAGLAKVAAIKSQQFSGGSGGGAAAGGGGMPSGGTESVGVDVGSLVPNQQTPTPEPVRAYVVENEISNKQALNKELQIQTTL